MGTNQSFPGPPAVPDWNASVSAYQRPPGAHQRVHDTATTQASCTVTLGARAADQERQSSMPCSAPGLPPRAPQAALSWVCASSIVSQTCITPGNTGLLPEIPACTARWSVTGQGSSSLKNPFLPGSHARSSELSCCCSMIGRDHSTWRPC